MRDLIVLFFHHKNDEITNYNFDSLKQSNPDTLCIPIHRGEPDHLPNAVDTYCNCDAWSEEANWFAPDIALINWFVNRDIENETAERYIFLEYDCYVNVDLREWYAGVWKRAAVVPRIKRPQYWETSNLDPKYRDVVIGCNPFNGIMLTHLALQTISERPYPVNVFCETRLPTILEANDFTFSVMPLECQSHNVAAPNVPAPLRGKGLIHPMKEIPKHDTDRSIQNL